MQHTKLSALILSALTFSGFAQADSFRQHAAHAHGQVEFNIAQDGSDVLVEILAPGSDVVGFEHAPTNHDQQHAIHEAVDALKKGATLLVLGNNAKCELVSAEVTHTLGGEDAHDEHHDEHNHDDEQHDAHADHDHHDHEEHDDHSDHDHENGHGEFNVQYQFTCDKPESLNQVETTWFAQFGASEAITLNLLTDQVQTSTKLTVDNPRFSF
jgi:hypothetical protein